MSCVFGIERVGFSLMCEGLGFAIACVVCSPLTSLVPRQLQYIPIFVSLLVMGVSWLLWIPDATQFMIVLVTSLVFGLVHGLHRTHSSGELENHAHVPTLSTPGLSICSCLLFNRFSFDVIPVLDQSGASVRSLPHGSVSGDVVYVRSFT